MNKEILDEDFNNSSQIIQVNTSKWVLAARLIVIIYFSIYSIGTIYSLIAYYKYVWESESQESGNFMIFTSVFFITIFIFNLIFLFNRIKQEIEWTTKEFQHNKLATLLFIIYSILASLGMIRTIVSYVIYSHIDIYFLLNIILLISFIVLTRAEINYYQQFKNLGGRQK